MESIVKFEPNCCFETYLRHNDKIDKDYIRYLIELVYRFREYCHLETKHSVKGFLKSALQKRSLGFEQLIRFLVEKGIIKRLRDSKGVHYTSFPSDIQPILIQNFYKAERENYVKKNTLYFETKRILESIANKAVPETDVSVNDEFEISDYSNHKPERRKVVIEYDLVHEVTPEGELSDEERAVISWLDRHEHGKFEVYLISKERII